MELNQWDDMVPLNSQMVIQIWIATTVNATGSTENEILVIRTEAIVEESAIAAMMTMMRQGGSSITDSTKKTDIMRVMEMIVTAMMDRE
jgi:hypothetical protein